MKRLAARRIAVLRGSVYTDRFDDDDALQKVIVNNYTSALKMTAMKRVDAAIIPEAMGDYLVREGSHQVTKASFGMKGRPSFITISKRSTFLEKKDELEKILRGMQADGSFERIMNLYR
ncbi:transporter substrate-binding domain-containing protein [Desulfococcaceae bacterium HSG7]|nr:transporter substrate-binding domain-containing protein [Desulfococcaceae bacterium HSG7]